MNHPTGMASESRRAIEELGAVGMQIYTNIKGQPLDHPDFDAFFEYMNESGKPIWMHPARGQGLPITSPRIDLSMRSGGPLVGLTKRRQRWRVSYSLEFLIAIRILISSRTTRAAWFRFLRAVLVLVGTRWVNGQATEISAPLKML